MNWDDPSARFALIEAVGPQEYNRQFADHVKQSTVSTVGGHAIRPVGTRFGQLFQVGNAGCAFKTLAEAETYASNNPV